MAARRRALPTLRASSFESSCGFFMVLSRRTRLPVRSCRKQPTSRLAVDKHFRSSSGCGQIFSRRQLEVRRARLVSPAQRCGVRRATVRRVLQNKSQRDSLRLSILLIRFAYARPLSVLSKAKSTRACASRLNSCNNNLLAATAARSGSSGDRPRDQVYIYEVNDARLARQKLARESSLARAIRTSDDDATRLFHVRTSYRSRR